MSNVPHRSRRHDSLLNSKEFLSEITALTAGAATIVLSVDASFRHWYAGVECFQDVDGASVAVPTAGTVTYTVLNTVKPNVEQDAGASNVVDHAVADTEVAWDGNTQTVKVVIASLAGDSVTHVRLRAVGNIS